MKTHNENIIKILEKLKSSEEILKLISEIEFYSQTAFDLNLSNKNTLEEMQLSLLQWLSEHPIYATESNATFDWINNNEKDLEMNRKFYHLQI